LPLYGAVVTVTSGGSTLDSCTTNATGCCTMSVLTTPGTYTVTVTFNGSTIYSASRSVVCGTNTIGIAAPSNVICCSGYYIPYNLTGTDAIGTFLLTYSASQSSFYALPTWVGCRIISVTAIKLDPAFCPGGCVTLGPATFSLEVCYLFQCKTSGGNHFYLERDWPYNFLTGGTTPYYYAQNTLDNCASPISACGAGPCGNLCGGGGNDSTGNANPSSSAPFAISFTMTPMAGNQTTDPIGGNVSVSQ
jgi:hypothetical protein